MTEFRDRPATVFLYFLKVPSEGLTPNTSHFELVASVELWRHVHQVLSKTPRTEEYPWLWEATPEESGKVVR